jgi:hypothetical protein
MTMEKGMLVRSAKRHERSSAARQLHCELDARGGEREETMRHLSTSCLVYTSMIPPWHSSPLRFSGTARTHSARLLFPPLRSTHPPHTPRHLRISDLQHLRVCISMIPIGIPLPAPVDHLGTPGCHPALSFLPHPHRTPEDDPLVGALCHGSPPPHGPAYLPGSRSTPS